MTYLIHIKSLLDQKLFLKHLLASFLIIACLFLAYGNTFQNGFMVDDYVFLVGKETIADRTFSEVWTKDYHKFYRPVAYTLLRWVNLISGNNPFGYQVYIFSSFVIISVLFYVLIYRLFKDYILSLLISLLYAVHPIHAHFVNYKTGNTLFVICMQLSTMMFLRFIDRKNIFLFLLSLLFYGAALLSHEISFMLPVFLFLIQYFLNKNSLKKSILLCLPFIAVLILFYIVRTNISKAISVPSLFNLDITFGQYVDLIRRSLVWYFKQLIWPHQILLVWDEEVLVKYSYLINMLFYVAILTISLWTFFKKRGSRLGFGWLVFIVGFLPVALISVVYTKFSRTAIMEPHWFGFSSIGFFILIAIGLLFIKDKINFKLWICLIVALLGIGILSTRCNNLIWKDEISYCRFWIKNNKFNLGPLIRISDLSVSDRGLNLKLYDNCEDLSYIAAKYLLLKSQSIAIQYNNLALVKNDDCAPAHFFYGVYYWDHGDREQSQLAFQRASRLNIQYYPPYENIKILLDKVNKGSNSSRFEIIRMLFGE